MYYFAGYMHRHPISQSTYDESFITSGVCMYVTWTGKNGSINWSEYKL